MKNPFQYGKEVSGYQFYDRKESMDELYRKLSDGSTNVVLYAPRRYGKTSMVLRVLERLRLDDFRCIYFNMAKISTIERFAEEYAAAVLALSGPLEKARHFLVDYLAHFHPSLSIASDGRCVIRFDYGERLSSQSLSEVLDLPEKLADELGGRPIVVAFDEFQEVAALSRELPLEGVFRSCIQTHRNVRYVFFGSKTHLMRRMFNVHSRPFYRSAYNLKLGKPPAAESAEFVSSRFAAEGIAIAAVLVERILELSETIPYYLQALSSLTFEAVVAEGRRAVEPADLEAAVARLERSNEDFYEEVLRGLSGAKRALVEALAAAPTSEFDEQYRRRHGLGVSSTVHSALRELERRGIVESDRNGYFIGDPFFARYVRHNHAAEVFV